jgi:hypothetical protein
VTSWPPIGKREVYHHAPVNVGGSDLSLRMSKRILAHDADYLGGGEGRGHFAVSGGGMYLGGRFTWSSEENTKTTTNT